MPLRGSLQLLLLFLARGKRRGIAGAIAGVVAAGLFLGGPTELTQALRERAWDRALAESPAQSSWPWTEASVPAKAKVQRLGLSAAVVKDGEGRATQALYAPRRQHAGAKLSASPAGSAPSAVTWPPTWPSCAGSLQRRFQSC